MLTLVTGGTGFIGQRLVKRLLERGERLRLLVRKTSNLTPFSGQPVEFAYGDVTDRPSVEAALTGCSHLYHLANVYDWWLPDYSLYYRVNVEGTRNVLEAALAAGVEKVVYTSSMVALPGASGEVFNETTPHRGYFVCEYERTKYLGEQIARELAEKGLPVVCVLPTGVYGPGDTKVMGRLLAAYLKRRLPALINIRTNIVYVDDVVEGHILAMERGKVGERYLLGAIISPALKFSAW
ncbi:MAG TPA: NAD-dependent epimerase/dehydratase family protein [Dehalococcoidia bacterium]|nr:NAD-dependent epimerase/dehydratase family protein [Dehalococcoidia bacterium]